ncbi:MAG: hypothetical protein ACI8QC_000769 [Planctomycetota bacterium]|jgi:hypothetical protein
MKTQHGHDRVCPTRSDGTEILFAHKVTQAKCQDRQRGQYHKCYTCEHNNALAMQSPSKPRSVVADRPKLAKRLAAR